MSFLRLLILGLLAYWFYRLIRGLSRKEQPRIRKDKSRSKSDPFANADIEEVSFTELPPEEADEKQPPSGQ